MSAYISIRQIARRLGVHPSTVSRALRNSPSISWEMKAKIRETAAEMGFQPVGVLDILNELKSPGERQGSTPLLAYLTWHVNDRYHRFRKFHDALEVAGKKAGYDMLRFYLEDYPSPGIGLDVLRKRGVEGLIIGQVFTESQLMDCDWSPFSSVATEFGHYLPPFDLVTSNSSTPYFAIWEMARRAGAERIGLTLPEDPLSETFATLRCWNHVLQSELPPSRRVPVHTYRRPRNGIPDKRLGEWMRRHKPDVVVTNPEAVYFDLLALGYKIPEQVYFACIQKHHAGSPDLPEYREIAGFEPDFDLQARLAIEHVAALVRRNVRAVPAQRVRILVERKWYPGASMPEAMPDTASIEGMAGGPGR